MAHSSPLKNQDHDPSSSYIPQSENEFSPSRKSWPCCWNKKPSKKRCISICLALIGGLFRCYKSSSIGEDKIIDISVFQRRMRIVINSVYNENETKKNREDDNAGR